MKNALSEVRHILLLILLLATSPSLKTEVEAKAARTSKARKIKFGRGVFNTRGLLVDSQDPSLAASLKPSQVESAAASPEPSLEPTTSEPVSRKASAEGAPGQLDDDDDDGLSTGAALGISIACCIVSISVILAVLHFVWKRRQEGAGYTPIHARPTTTAAGQ